MTDTAHDAHRPNVKLYIGVFAALLTLTLLTVVVSKFHLPRHQAVALALFIASMKAGLVAAIFMHLWGEKSLIFKVLAVTVAFGCMMTLPILDAAWLRPKITKRMPVADQHPIEEAAK